MKFDFAKFSFISALWNNTSIITDKLINTTSNFSMKVILLSNHSMNDNISTFYNNNMTTIATLVNENKTNTRIPNNVTTINNSMTNITNETYQNNSLIAISFVNGIYHSENEWREISNELSHIFNIEIHPFYNPSTGSWFNDAQQATFDLFQKPSNGTISLQLAQHLRNLLLKLDSNGRILHLAHSGGAILTYLAAKYHLTNEEKSRIDVITFGGGHSITKKYFQGYTVNYYAKNDPLSIIDIRAYQLLNSELRENMINWIELKDIKYNTTFIFLNGIENNPILDHRMDGPTYRQALIYESIELQKRLKLLIKLKNKNSNLIRKLRKNIANYTNIHRFWDNPIQSINYKWNSLNFTQNYYNTINSTNIIKNIRKSIANITNLHHFNDNITNYSIEIQSNMNITQNIHLFRKYIANQTGFHHFWNKNFQKLSNYNNAQPRITSITNHC